MRSNLVDYYLVQHGNYDVPAMYVKSGQYWHNPSSWTYYGFNLKVLLAYFAGVVCGFPFVSCAWFKGPLADRLDGADLSWIPGSVTTVVYLALVSRRRPIRATAGRQQPPPQPTSHLEDRYEPCQPEEIPVVRSPYHRGHAPQVEVQCGRPITAFDIVARMDIHP